MKSYSEKLKDPRWQRKRLEILQRDNFKCRCCESAESTLHVHHISYIKNKMPWEYEDFDLITLCDYCHEVWHHVYDAKYATEIIFCVVKLYNDLEIEDIDRFCNNKNI